VHWLDRISVGWLKRTPIFADGRVMLIFQPDGRLLHSQGRPGDPRVADRLLQACAASNLPAPPDPAEAQAINTIGSLLCEAGDGRFFLGMVSPISDSEAKKPAQGNLVLFSPFLRSDYGPHLLTSLKQLEKAFVVPSPSPPSATPGRTRWAPRWGWPRSSRCRR
jgi:hypothetical protein